MRTWGVDLGVRSFTAAALDDSGDLIAHHVVAMPTPRRVRDAALDSRWQELRGLAGGLAPLIAQDDVLFVEDPRYATGAGKNISTSLALAHALGAVVGASPCPTYLVLVSAWKKDVVGNGNADKDLVARWLAARHPRWSRRCEGDQNRVDATCIALYGYRSRAATARGVDSLHQAVGLRL